MLHRINDLPHNVKSNLKLYADDALMYISTHLYIQPQMLIATVQRDLDSLSEWASIWQMTFNPSNSEFSSKHRFETSAHRTNSTY